MDNCFSNTLDLRVSIFKNILFQILHFQISASERQEWIVIE